MGARIAVDIPEDEVGTIETESHSIAWCVIEMCSCWMDGSQDEADFKTIPSHAMKMADRFVPKTLQGYSYWRQLRLCEAQEEAGKLWLIEKNGNWPPQIFEPAREFLRQYGASVSTNDAVVTL